MRFTEHNKSFEERLVCFAESDDEGKRCIISSIFLLSVGSIIVPFFGFFGLLLKRLCQRSAKRCFGSHSLDQ